MAYLDDVTQLYQQQLGRAPDAGGLEYFMNVLQNGGSVNDVVAMMQAAPEAQQAAPAAPSGIADWEQTINNAYTAQGMAPVYTASDPMSPWEASNGNNAEYIRLLQQSGALPATYNPAQPVGAQTGGGAATGNGAPQLPGGGIVGWYGNGNTGSAMGSAPTNNPNMQGQIDYLRQQSDFALGQNLNSIRSNSVGNGGLGGSRQGVAQGVATGLANQGYTGNVANMLSTDWQNQQNRNLTQYGMDQNFYTAQRGQDQSGAALGANLVGLGTQLPWTGINGANSTYGQYTGFGNTTNTSQSGGGMQGLLGGALGGAQMAKAWGWI